MAKSRVHAADVPLRRARALQRLRRACLALSLLFTIALPIAHTLANANADGRARVGAVDVGAVDVGGAVGGAVVGAPWSVSLFGVELLDPLALVGLIATRHATLAVVVAALPLLVAVVLLGRYFCGWLCPYALVVGAANAARSLLQKVGVPVLDVKMPRSTSLAVLGAIVVGSAVAGLQLAPLVYPPSIIGRSLWSAVAAGGAGGGAFVIGALFLFDTFVSRAGFCRSLCPGGATFRLLASASPVSIVRDASTCTSCALCDVVCNMGQTPMTDAVDAGCDRCARCVSACPTGALDIVLIARRPRRRPS